MLVFEPQMVKVCEIGILGRANFHENVRKELLNFYRTCQSLYKILVSMGTSFYTHELSHIIPENVSKHQIQ